MRVAIQGTHGSFSEAAARRRWPDLEVLRNLRDGDFTIGSRDRADRTWIVTSVVADGPVAYYLYQRPARRAD
mgnify:CR=1 FL=1